MNSIGGVRDVKLTVKRLVPTRGSLRLDSSVLSAVGAVAMMIAAAACGSDNGAVAANGPDGGGSGQAGSGRTSSGSSSSGGAASSGGASGGASGSASGSGTPAGSGGPAGSGAPAASGSTAGSGTPAGSGAGGSGAPAGSGAGSGSPAGSGNPMGGSCGAGDPILAAAGVAEPSLPVASGVCQTISAAQSVSSGGVPSEGNLDTQRIQSALTACKGKAVKLVASGANNALVTGSLAIDSVTLWVDAGVTLYASRGSLGNAVLTVTGTSPAIVGDGIIDGQGGEPRLGGSSAWPGPAFIVASASNFVMYKIHLYNSPGFHVKVTGDHFVIWGTTLLTPSKTKNSAGTNINPVSAHNTDGIDPGSGTSAPTTNGFIVCNMISVGDDHIAIKGGNNGHVSKLTIAHNHFGAGHGMSIGSETGPGGIDGVQVYDLTVDGTVFPSNLSSDLNGIRIKSYPGAGGLVTNVSYNDVCTRHMVHPILITPHYTQGTVSGGGTPQFTNIHIANFHDLADSVSPVVTLDGFDGSHPTTVSLDNVVVDGSPSVSASSSMVTLGPGGASFAVPGAGGSGTPHAIDCSSRWVTFPVTFP